MCKFNLLDIRLPLKACLLAGDNGDALIVAQTANVCQRLFRSAPSPIHSLQRIADGCPISFVIGEHALASFGSFVMTPDRFGIESSQRCWIA